MKIKINLNILAIVIMAIVATIITISIIMAHATYTNAYKERPANTAVRKINNEISFMAVYLDDGTIIAYFKPDRIGKNMLGVDRKIDRIKTITKQ